MSCSITKPTKRFLHHAKTNSCLGIHLFWSELHFVFCLRVAKDLNIPNSYREDIKLGRWPVEFDPLLGLHTELLVLSWHCSTLRKHVCAIYYKKKKTLIFLRWKNVIFFLIFAQNIDCWYTSELPVWGGSNEYPQSMF